MRILLTEGDDGLARMAAKLDGFAGREQLPPDVRRDLHLVIDEIVNNIVRHAQPRHPRVVVHLSVDAGALVIRIVDDGEAFDPTSRADPDTTLGLDDRPIGGLGIYLVRQLMNEVRYRRFRGRNDLTLRRSLSGGPAGAMATES